MVRKTRKLISKTRGRTTAIAPIDINGALYYVATFLVDAFLSNQLTQKGEDNLVAFFNNYYQTSLSVEQLKDVFENCIKLSDDKPIFLAQSLKEILENKIKQFGEKGVGRKKCSKKDIVFKQVFDSMGRRFGLSKKTKLNLDCNFVKTVKIYDSNECKKKVQEIVVARYNPELKETVDVLIKDLGNLYSELDVSEAQKIIIIQNKLQELSRVFFEKSVQNRPAAIEKVKDAIVHSKLDLVEPSFLERLVIGSQPLPASLLKKIVAVLNQSMDDANCEQDEALVLDDFNRGNVC